MSNKIIIKIGKIAKDCVELSMDNYDESQVEELNNAMIEIHGIIEDYNKKYISALQEDKSYLFKSEKK